MTLLEDRAVAPVEPLEHPPATGLLAWLTSTDHKRIGVSYMVTAFAFYLLGGLLAMGMRAELAEPGQQVVGRDTYNEMFTMHGSIMLLLFVGPFAFGLANYLVPLQIGARDMAFPRLNLLSYWVFLGGGLVMVSGFLTADGPADFGWFAYAPLSDSVNSPGLGGDLWIAGVLLTGMSGVLTSVNIVTTVLTMRARGMHMFRMPIFTWNMLVTSILVLLAFPVLTSAGVMLFADRHLGGAHLRPGPRGGADPLAAPVLVLRPPRGLHAGPAVLRGRHRDLRRVRPAAGVRLPGPGAGHAGHRRPVGQRVGPPHVRHR